MSGAYLVAPLDGHPRIGARDVINLWVGEDALTPEVAARRVEEVLLVATADAEPDAVAAVCTLVLQEDPQLRQDLWFYRTYVGRRHRRSAIAEALLTDTIAHLQRRWEDGDRRGAGIAFHLEYGPLRAVHPEAVWPRVHMSYVTRSPGSELRVRYFPGALAPDPPRAS